MRLHNRVTAFVDGDEYGLARVVVAVRMAVVASVGGVLVLVGPAWVRQHVPAAVGILIAATVYAMVLLANPKFEARRTRYSWAVALADSAITLAWIAVTGGPHSPVVAVLPLVVIASAARLSFIETLLLSTLLGLAYTAVIVPSSSTPATALSLGPRPAGGRCICCSRRFSPRACPLWRSANTAPDCALWSKPRPSTPRPRRNAICAHGCSPLTSPNRTGCRCWCTSSAPPIASLEALLDALAGISPMTDADRSTSLQLASRHTRHVVDMLDALSDVALSRRPPTFSGGGRVRQVDVADIVTAAADAVGLTAPRLQLAMTADLSAVAINAQGLRRVLTNLLENAARHGRGAPVDVTCSRHGNDLVIAVADRGPRNPRRGSGRADSKVRQCRRSARHRRSGTVDCAADHRRNGRSGEFRRSRWWWARRDLPCSAHHRAATRPAPPLRAGSPDNFPRASSASCRRRQRHAAHWPTLA